jgi:hypothetical protein
MLAFGSRSRFRQMSDDELTKVAQELLVKQARRGRLLLSVEGDGKIIDPITDVERLKKLLIEKIVFIEDEE